MMPGRRYGRHDRTLELDLARLRDTYAVDCLVALVQEQREIVRQMRYESAEQYFAMVRDSGIESYHMPIRDKWLPSDYATLCRTVDWIIEKWRDCGMQVVIHCAGGMGRAGTLCACVMFALQWDAKQRARKMKRSEDTEQHQKRKQSDREASMKMLPMSEIIRTIQESRMGTLRNPIQRIFLLYRFPGVWSKWVREGRGSEG